MKAFVAGANGETGRRIVAELVKRDIPVRAMVRDLSTAREVLPAQAELVVGDVLKKETLEQAIADCDVILCATGAKPGLDFTAPYLVDYEGTKNLVNLAKMKEVKHFVFVSSLCASVLIHPLNLFWLVLFWKKQAEDYLKVSGIPYTIVRPGGLKNEDNANMIVMASADTLFEGSIPRAKVAQICVEALFHAQSQNKILEVVSKPGISDRSMAELFTSVT